jgi:hypothetical protein
MAAARSKNDAIEKLSSLAPVILEHLIKLQCYPKHSSAKHWQAELDSWAKLLSRYHRGKGATGKNFKLSDFVWCIYEERAGDSPVIAIIETYGPMQKPIDPAKLKKMAEDFGRKVMQQALTGKGKE